MKPTLPCEVQYVLPLQKELKKANFFSLLQSTKKRNKSNRVLKGHKTTLPSFLSFVSDLFMKTF